MIRGSTILVTSTSDLDPRGTLLARTVIEPATACNRPRTAEHYGSVVLFVLRKLIRVIGRWWNKRHK
jgi:hypothetical protein